MYWCIDVLINELIYELLDWLMGIHKGSKLRHNKLKEVPSVVYKLHTLKTLYLRFRKKEYTGSMKIWWVMHWKPVRQHIILNKDIFATVG